MNKFDVRSPVAYALIPYLDKTSLFKEKMIERLAPVRDEYRKSLSPKDKTSKSPSTRGLRQGQKTTGKSIGNEVSRTGGVLKNFSMENEALGKEHENEKAVAAVNKKLAYVKACIRNFISAANKLSLYVNVNNSEGESALMSYDNTRATLEQFSQALVTLLKSRTKPFIVYIG